MQLLLLLLRLHFVAVNYFYYPTRIKSDVYESAGVEGAHTGYVLTHTHTHINTYIYLCRYARMLTGKETINSKLRVKYMVRQLNAHWPCCKHKKHEG